MNQNRPRNRRWKSVLKQCREILDVLDQEAQTEVISTLWRDYSKLSSVSEKGQSTEFILIPESDSADKPEPEYVGSEDGPYVPDFERKVLQPIAEHMLQQFRRFGGASITVTQDSKDIPSNSFIQSTFGWYGSIRPDQRDQLQCLSIDLQTDYTLKPLTGVDTVDGLSAIESNSDRYFFRFDPMNYDKSLLLVKSIRKYGIELTCDEAIPDVFRSNLKASQVEKR